MSVYMYTCMCVYIHIKIKVKYWRDLLLNQGVKVYFQKV